MKVRIFCIYLMLLSYNAFTLPINFGRPQEPRQYQEIVSKNYNLYHDAKAQNEALGLLKSLEAGKPILEKWLGVQRKSKMPIVVSATTSNTSFANFLTDAIELQTMARGGRDLAWHELTHSTMYIKFNNFLGHAGSIFHLIWMPTWWIEGLAEALSVSARTAFQLDIERRHALDQSWPTYAKLHNLYGSSYASEGYGLAGAFVSYLLQKYDASKLPQVLTDFYDYSLPHWWPVAATPFADTLPMDMALKEWTGKNGEELWDEYKLYAETFWNARTSENERKFITETKDSSGYYDTRNLQFYKNRLIKTYLGKESKSYSLEFRNLGKTETKDPPASEEISRELPNHSKLTPIHLQSPSDNFYITRHIRDNREEIYSIYRSRDPSKIGKIFVRNRGNIDYLFQTSSHLYWLEIKDESTSLCYASKARKRPKVTCPMVKNQPANLVYLGKKGSESQTTEIWLNIAEETLIGDKSQIVVFDTSRQGFYKIKRPYISTPISVSFSKKDIFLLTEGHSSRQIEKIDAMGNCIGIYEPPFYPHVIRANNEYTYLTAYTGDGYGVVRANSSSFPFKECSDPGSFISPIMYAQLFPGATLKEALSNTSSRKPLKDSVYKKLRSNLSKAGSTAQTRVKGSNKIKRRPAQWRGKPQFAFPWIGADAEGLNFGVQSIPLMDEMQNETLQLVALYGLQSTFPTLSLVLDSTRYQTYISSSIFNSQTYNGSIGGDVLYYRETGASVSFSRYFPVQDFSLNYGIKSAYFKPIIGPANFVIEDQETSFNLRLSKSIGFSYFSWSNSISSIVVPEFINNEWTYNKLRLNTTFSTPINLMDWRISKLSLGISTSRVRGKRTKFLKEEYRALKTFVPGSGGGLNGITLPITGPGAITSASRGDTQARAKLIWTIPLVPDLEALLGIVYLQRLDFSAFFNYGGAWTGTEPPSNSLVGAQGYSLDLQADIKGVNINVGIGAGQVEGNSWDSYFLFGFDTIVDVDTT